MKPANKRGQAVAGLAPAGKKKKDGLQWPDFAARMKRIFPNGPLKGATAAELIDDMRGKY